MTPRRTVLAEFDKGRKMSRKDVAAALRLLPKFKDKADSTVETAAKDLIRELTNEDLIEQTRASAPNRPALYREKVVGTASA